MLQITAEEINFIIYQYLQESGFAHSAYTFGKESNIIENKFKHFHIPAGMLVVFLEKALTLIHIETHYNEGDRMTVCNEPFTLLNPHHCSTVTREKKPGDLNTLTDKSNIDPNPLDGIINNSSGNIKQRKDLDQEMEDESRKEEFDPTHPKMATGRPGGVYGAAPVRKSSFLENSESKIKILESKSNKTLKVAWNPKNHMLVFGGDIELHDVYLYKGRIFMVMDYLDGGCLTPVVEDMNLDIPENVIGYILRETLQGIYSLHKRGIIHRDIKSDNILIEKDTAAIKLTDFGYSCQLTQEKRMRESRVGTLYWMAPELLKGDNKYNEK